jgi:hypothetical protein
MKFDQVMVTPEYARVLLQKNQDNRPLHVSRVKLFEAELRDGNFKLTHQGIAIGSSGRLLDGQHRLHAIANTGISAPLMVATGVPDESFAVLDTGIKRSASDVLAICGSQYCTEVASAIRLYLHYVNLPNLAWTGNAPAQNATTSKVLSEYESDPANWQWAARLARSTAMPRIAVPAPIGCLFYLAAVHHGYGQIYISKFADKLRHGLNLSTGDPVLAYRNRMMLGTDRPNSQARLADCIKLFNAYSARQSLKIFKAQQYPPMPSMLDASESIHDDATT